MLWVLKRTVSMRRFFWAPKTYAKYMGKKIFTISRRFFCLSKPVLNTKLRCNKNFFSLVSTATIWANSTQAQSGSNLRSILDLIPYLWGSVVRFHIFRAIPHGRLPVRIAFRAMLLFSRPVRDLFWAMPTFNNKMPRLFNWNSVLLIILY